MVALTGIYGNPDISKMHESWARLKQLKGTTSLLWLAIGDFNELTSMSEKEEGSARPRQQLIVVVCGI